MESLYYISAFAVGLTLPLIGYKCCDSIQILCNKLRRRKKKLDAVVSIDFLGPNFINCRRCLKVDRTCFSKKVCGLSIVRKICAIIESARESVDICVCLITIEKFTSLLSKLAEKGIRVRVICDGNQMKRGTTGPDAMKLFQLNNVDVIPLQNEYLMHHKFAIVDSKIVINGSLNWTTSGFFSNYENLEISSDMEDVQPFIDEFESFWAWLNKRGHETFHVVF